MPSFLLFRASWRFFRHHPWQLGLTLLSIALGSAVIVAVDLANHSAGQSFARSVQTLSGTMTHEITRRNGDLLPDDVYRWLRVERGYRNSSPQRDLALSRQGLHYTLLGLDPFATPLQQSDGEGLPVAVITALLTEPGAVVANAALAAQLGVVVGERFSLDYQGQPVSLKLLAVLAGDWGDVLYADLGTVQALAAAPGLSRIQLQLDEVAAQTLAAQLPDTLLLTAFADRQQAFGQMTAAFSTNLLAMSLLAMLIGAFLVYNTMTFSVLQRRQAFAVARMVGVTGGQLFRHLLLEAMVLGLVGGGLGILLGIVLGQGLLLLVSQTISDLFVSISVSDLGIAPLTLLKGLLITLLAVLVATLAPAVEAARVQPVMVQRRSSLEQANPVLSHWLGGAGLLIILLSYLLLSVSAQSLLLGFLALFMLVLGYGLCVPWVLRLVLAALQQFSAGSGLLLRMAVRGVQSGLSRTSLAVIALCVAVAATVGVSMMIGSFRHSVADWLAMTLSSDVYVSAVSADGSRVNGELHADWWPRIAALPAVVSVSSGLSLEVLVDDQATAALVMEPGEHSAAGFDYIAGDAAIVWPRFLAGEGVLVSEPFAYHRGKQPGDTLQISTEQSGVLAMPVLGVYRDYSAPQGVVSIPRRWYAQHWADQHRSSIGIKLRVAADLPVVVQQLQDWAAELELPGQPLVVREVQRIREHSLEIFDRTFAVTHVLRLLVVIVAFVGVFSALMALFLERGREFGILRATGFTPGQVGKLVMLQTALLGVLAGVLALPLGWLLADILIDIINRRSFGWTMQTYFFAWLPVQAVLLALLAAVLAGIYPVKRIAGLVVRESLRG